MKLLVDGNLTTPVRAGLIVIGALLILLGLGLETIPNWLGIVAFLLGIAAIFIGGLSSRAKLIGIKPFGESEWRKAKRTYDEKDQSLRSDR
jgi:hypothetical protein